MGKSREIFPCWLAAARFSLGFQPLQVIAIVPCSFSRILYASWRSREQRASVPETGQAVAGQNTATTVLFETQGLMLFSVVRGGIEYTRRLARRSGPGLTI